MSAHGRLLAQEELFAVEASDEFLDTNESGNFLAKGGAKNPRSPTREKSLEVPASRKRVERIDAKGFHPIHTGPNAV